MEINEFKPEEKYMQRALELAKKAVGYTNPNPMVGAVIVKDGRIIGEGYHKRCGEFHAERNALMNLSEPAEGATMYVTLEPCCHQGRTLPCTKAIIENKIARVVIGSNDPNPLVSGKGAEILRKNNIEVYTEFMKDECDEINQVFFKYITTKKPYVVMKYAMTCDGKIATKTKESKWITGEAARKEVQYMRHKYMAIMVGTGTVAADDPMLNVRIEGLKSPIRVVCDSGLNISTMCNIIKTAKEYKTYIACAYEREKFFDGNYEDEKIEIARKKYKEITDKGAEVIFAGEKNGKTDINNLMKILGSIGIDSVFVEGGGTLNDAIVRAGEVNRVEVFIAPKIFGGKEAKSPVCGEGISEISDALNLKLENIKRIDEDILLSYIKRG